MQPNAFVEVLATALRAARLAVTTAGDRISVPALARELRVLSVESLTGSHRHAVISVIEVDSMQTIARGFGADEDRAAETAARNWIEGALLVLHSFWRPEHDRGRVELAYMHVQDLESGERYGWRIHIGPQVAVYLAVRTELPSQGAIFDQVFDYLRSLPSSTTPYWFEASFTRTQEQIEARCWMSGTRWPQVEEVLKDWVRGWSMAPEAGVGVQQYLLLEPIPADDAAREVGKRRGRA